MGRRAKEDRRLLLSLCLKPILAPLRIPSLRFDVYLRPGLLEHGLLGPDLAFEVRSRYLPQVFGGSSVRFHTV